MQCSNPRCSNECPPAKGPGQPRKWCSEQCRKLTLYGTDCPSCGNRVRADTGARGCLSCFNAERSRVRAEEADGRAVEAIQMRSAGLLNTEIAEALGTTQPAISHLIYRARKHGETVVRSPYHRGYAVQAEIGPDLVRRYTEGESVRQLGLAYGLHPTTVKRLLLREGVEVRDRREAQKARWRLAS